MTTLSDLERRAKTYADTRASVAAIVERLNAGIDALRRHEMPALKKAIAAAAEHHDRLKTEIEAHPELFEKPKSVVMHGIKLGYRKGPGGIEFDNAEQVVKLIRKHFPEAVDVLVKVAETPVKSALAQLSVAELKKLGVTVQDTGDEPFIKPTDSAVEKLVEQLLKSAIDETADT